MHGVKINIAHRVDIINPDRWQGMHSWFDGLLLIDNMVSKSEKVCRQDQNKVDMCMLYFPFHFFSVRCNKFANILGIAIVYMTYVHHYHPYFELIKFCISFYD